VVVASDATATIIRNVIVGVFTVKEAKQSVMVQSKTTAASSNWKRKQFLIDEAISIIAIMHQLFHAEPILIGNRLLHVCYYH